MKAHYKVAIFGASPDTPNMGVSALFFSLVSGIYQHINSVEFIVFDNGLGSRTLKLEITQNNIVDVTCFGARVGKRLFRPENLYTMYGLSKLGKFGALLSEGIALIDSCDAVIDVSGGDSFSDIYGIKRFNSTLLPKLITKNRHKTLILAPQTYGPYRSKSSFLAASKAVKQADMVWARDEHSYQILKALLGNSYDPVKHLCGVDMAFKLPVQNASHLVQDKLLEWLNNKDEKKPLVGINISGLIYQNPESAKKQYQFIADYNAVVIQLVNEILLKSNARIVLISHVMDREGHYESDFAACSHVSKQIAEPIKDRVILSPPNLNQSQVKWLIAQMDWFCGTRMHATIAALSSGVPTAAISYSDKTLGVFASCNQSSYVMDPRLMNETEIVLRLVKTFSNRLEIKKDLDLSLNRLKRIADWQISKLSETVLAGN